MVSKFALLSSLLLASAALAVPSSLVEASLARGCEDRQPQPINHVVSRADLPSGIHDPSAGLVLTGRSASPNTIDFSYVAAVITVPVLNDHPGEVPTYAVAAIVLGNYEQSRTMKLGFAFGSEVSGCVYYYPIVEEDDAPLVLMPNIPIRPGDLIYARISLSSNTSVALYLHNRNLDLPPASMSHDISEPLYPKDAVWIVHGHHQFMFLNFGNVTFNNYLAGSKTPGYFSRSDFLTYNITNQQGKYLTSSSRSQSSVIINRLTNV